MRSAAPTLDQPWTGDRSPGFAGDEDDEEDQDEARVPDPAQQAGNSTFVATAEAAATSDKT